MDPETGRGECSDPSCRCDHDPDRRAFLRLVGLTAAAWAARPLPVMAGPFEDTNDYLKLIPRDKRLDPQWIASLSARGRKDVYQEARALEHIGMPVGGLFAGTVYLGGDGRLWLWDIFNRDQEGIAPRTVPYQGRDITTRDGANYVDPAQPASPFLQGFAIRIGDRLRRLERAGFDQITFEGRYPIGRVSYRDRECAVAVELEAFSPFIPLDVADSSLPATVMSYTVRNGSDGPIDCEVRGWLENPVALDHRQRVSGRRVNHIRHGDGLTLLIGSAADVPKDAQPVRDDIVFADFEAAKYDGWTAAGEAFGTGPIDRGQIPGYQGDVGGQGSRVVNSHASAPGDGVAAKDARTGTLTSRPFPIERNFIYFHIGGGNHPGQTCLNLLVDDRVIASATGRDDNRMAPGSFPTAGLQGKTARLQVVDRASGPWGNIGVDQIVFSDRPSGVGLMDLPDFGTMALALLDEGDDVAASADCDEAGGYEQPVAQASRPLDQSLIGGLRRRLSLASGEARTVTFVVAWHFPNFIARGVGHRRVGHWYASRFDDAAAVARYVADHFERLSSTTRRWVETWYDSSLPCWLLDRTMANTSTLATTTCYRFRDGRFWAWEGIGCCEGTCTHVWHYAQAPGRLFPEIEREHRRRVDFGLAQHPDGGIGMRAGLDRANEPAHDGQCGRILGAYREHQMSVDDAFLRDLWPRVKAALEFMIAQDGDEDGMAEGAQPNTLDAAWYGRVSFLASLYLAALRAGAAMATEVGDRAFAARCRTIADRGALTILGLFNGEYFIQREDPAHPDAIGVGPGCYIDQVFGQTWAHWVGLGRLFDRDKQLSALRALWDYNFVPDVGPFRAHFRSGRWYAAAGDAGLLMCTWPRGGQDPGAAKHWQSMYFNECMSGFEWQAAAHMIWEGDDQPDLLEKGLAVARAIHDRYDARLRNPYNEIECSDHYARAMASFGAYQAACGFEYHGPKGHIGFAPRLTPDAFHCAFTAAEGWGTFSQSRTDAAVQATIRIKYGRLRLRTLALVPRAAARPRTVTLDVDGEAIEAALTREGGRILMTPSGEVTLAVDQVLNVAITE